jgi:lipoprotein-releasing system permease protein
LNFLFAWRYFKAKKSATAINIIAWVTVTVIAIATACQVLVLSVFNGFEDLVKSLYSSFYTDLKVTPTKGKTFVLTSTQLNSIKQQPGIQAISLSIEENALLQNGDYQTFVDLKGVDSNYTYVSGVAAKIIDGQFNLGNADNPEIVVGIGVQSAIGVHPDDKSGILPSILTVVLPKRATGSSNDPSQSLSEGNTKASGVFSIQQEFDSKYAITNIDFLKQQTGFSPDEYSALEIKLTRTADVQSVQQNLSNLLGTAFVVQTRYEQNTSLYKSTKLEKWFIYAILTLILTIAMFNIISSLTMLVLEKQKDIAVLQSMGASKNRIVSIFLSEGLLLGSIGTISGILLATAICIVQLKFKVVKLQGGSFLIDYFPVKLEIMDFLLVIATTGIIIFCASWFPARKAANSKIILN